MNKKKILLPLILVAAVALPAYAQSRPDRRPPQGAGPQADGKDMQKRMTKMRGKLLRERLGLNEEKAKKVEKIFEQFSKKSKPARTQLREARTKLRDLLQSDSNDQAAYRQAVDTLHGLHNTLHDVRNKEFEALKAELTPKQQAQLLRALHRMKRHMRGRHRGPRGGKGKRGPRGGKGRRGNRPPRRGGGFGPPGQDGPRGQGGPRGQDGPRGGGFGPPGQGGPPPAFDDGPSDF